MRWRNACLGLVFFFTACLTGTVLPGQSVNQPDSPQPESRPQAPRDKALDVKARGDQRPDVDVTTTELQTQLQGDDLQVRRRVAIEIRELSLPQQQRLLPVFVDRLRNEKDGQVRLAVLAVLTDMGPAASGAVEALAEAIRDDYGGKYDEETHQDYRAALALAAIGRPSIEALRTLVSEEKTNVRAEAAMALGRIGPDAADAIDDLLRLVNDDDEWVRNEASEALGRIGEAALEPLLKGINHPNPAVRASVIGALGTIRTADERRTVAIQSALEDHEGVVQAAAITGLDSLDLSAANWQRLVSKSLQSDHDVVRLAAINAVSGHRDRLDGMRDGLIQLLRDKREGVVEHAAFLLHQLGSPVIDDMLATLEGEDAPVEAIGNAISMIGPKGTPRLHAALREAPLPARQAAALALGKIRPVAPETAEALASGLDSPEHKIREACLESFGALAAAGRTATPAVISLLDDPKPSIRATSIRVLFRIAPRDESLLEHLVPMIDDPEPIVQFEAIEALRAMGPQSRPALPATIGRLLSDVRSVRKSAALFVGSHGAASAEAVPSLTGMLMHPDDGWRLVVVVTLGQLGAASQPAFSELSALLDDSNKEIRVAAIKAIGNLGIESELLVPTLAKTLQDQDQEVRVGGMRIMRSLGAEGIVLVPDLIPLAANEDERRSVRRVLERLQGFAVDLQLVSELSELLEHEHAEVRILAIRFLGSAGEIAADSLPRLESLLEDPNEEVRREATTALEAINPVSQ